MSEYSRPTLGELLRSEREKRGFSIEQVSSATKIGVKILQLIEEDRYSSLPALPFVKGFVRNYARFLGLESERLLADYHDFLVQNSQQRPNREGGMSGYAFERPEGEQARRTLWLVMGGMTVLGGLVFFLFKPALKHRHSGHIDKLRAEASASPSPFGSPTAIAAMPVPSSSSSAAASFAPSPSPLFSAVASAATSSPAPAAAPAHVEPKPEKTEKFIAPKKPLVFALTPPPSPSPSPKPKPTETKKPAAVASPSASPVAVAPPSAAPATVSPAAPSPTPSPSATSGKPDPLQSGVDYASPEIKYKLVLRSLADVWVRYQCDDKKLMKFPLKAGKVLVLRGKQKILLQVSNPSAITLSYNGKAQKKVAEVSTLFDHQRSATVIFPSELKGKIDELVTDKSTLPTTPDPVENDSASAGMGTENPTSGASPSPSGQTP